MTIISISVNDRILKEMDILEKELGFSGRSEVVRAAVRLLLADKKEKSKLKGILDAALVLVHEDKYSEEVSALRHKYQDIVKTQVHNHIANHKCFEIFILHGDASRVVSLLESFQTNRKIEYVKLIVS